MAEQLRWEFYNTHEAFPGNYAASRDAAEMQIGLYSSEGGCVGEFSIVWKNLDTRAPSPELQVFDDAWVVFFDSLVPAILTANADRRIGAEELGALLVGAGFMDMTANYRKHIEAHR